MAVFEEAAKYVPEGAKILVDTAPSYGQGAVEKWLGRFNRRHKPAFLVVTKCGRRTVPGGNTIKDWHPDFLRQDVENSLRRLETDSLFLCQLHNPSMPKIRSGAVFETLEGLREESLIDWYGISVNSIEEGIAAIECCTARELPGFVSVQFIFSPVTKGNNYQALLSRASERQIALIAREVLLRGFLTDKHLSYGSRDLSRPALKKLVNLFGKEQISQRVNDLLQITQNSDLTIAQVAILFAIQHEQISTSLVGISRSTYLREALAATRQRLNESVLRQIAALKDLEPT